MSRCVNPYLNLSVTTDGSVRPCCMSTRKYNTDNDQTTVNNASILEFWNSKSRHEMISALDSGHKIPECEVCWKEERAGKKSKRIRDNEIYKNKQLAIDMRPVVVDLSMSNLCNIKCRICSPIHSTQWVTEQAQILSPNNLKKFTTLEKWIPFKESFKETNDFFWKDIVELLPSAERLDFAGGEPFYIDKHWDIVKLCVENNWSKNQCIHYNTNGTIFPEKQIHLLDQFKTVDIQISTDGLFEKFEYLRHGAEWNKVEQVIDQFLSVKSAGKANWTIGVCLSVSMFNILDFFEIYEYYNSKGLSVYVNIVYDHRGIKCLPEPVKQIIIDKLSKTKSKWDNYQWEENQNMIINHMRNTAYCEQTWKESWFEIKLRDKIRKESFESTFPDLYNLLKEYIIDYTPEIPYI